MAQGRWDYTGRGQWSGCVKEDAGGRLSAACGGNAGRFLAMPDYTSPKVVCKPTRAIWPCAY